MVASISDDFCADDDDTSLDAGFFEVDWDPWDPEEEGDGDGYGTGDSAASAEVGAVGDSAADANEGKEEDGDETHDQRKIEPRQFRKDARLVFWR